MANCQSIFPGNIGFKFVTENFATFFSASTGNVSPGLHSGGRSQVTNSLSVPVGFQGSSVVFCQLSFHSTFVHNKRKHEVPSVQRTLRN